MYKFLYTRTSDFVRVFHTFFSRVFREQKICLRYFKICQTYFELCALFFSFLPRGYNTLKISFHILESQNSFYRDRFSPFFIQNTSTAFSTDTRIFSSIKQSTNEKFYRLAT